MTEMLLQSHDGAIHIFPALPDAWSSGKITGVRARGAFTLDITWKNKKIVELKIYSSLGNNCRLRLPSSVKSIKGLKKAAGKNPNPFYQPTDTETDIEMNNSFFTYDLQTQAGETYVLKGGK
jgi:alpha-L-fucosidase 2